MSEPIPHKRKVAIVEFLIKPETMKEKYAWGQQLKMLNQLIKDYPDEEFWFKIDFTFMLNSFAYFKTKEGAEELKRQWNLYRMMKGNPTEKPKFDLDNKDNPDKINDKLPKVQDAIDWASL